MVWKDGGTSVMKKHRSLDVKLSVRSLRTIGEMNDWCQADSAAWQENSHFHEAKRTQSPAADGLAPTEPWAQHHQLFLELQEDMRAAELRQTDQPTYQVFWETVKTLPKKKFVGFSKEWVRFTWFNFRSSHFIPNCTLYKDHHRHRFFLFHSWDRFYL